MIKKITSSFPSDFGFRPFVLVMEIRIACRGNLIR